MRGKAAGAPPRQRKLYVFWQGDMKQSLRVQSVTNKANNQINQIHINVKDH